LGASTRTSGDEYNTEDASEPGITIQFGYVLFQPEAASKG
jgi:hypothetical protein